MKQITFKKAFAIIFICALCASYFLLKEGKQNFSDLTFSNIEALASGESGSKDCYMAGSLSCNGGYYKYKKTRSHTDGFQRNNAKCLDEKGISRFVPHSSF